VIPTHRRPATLRRTLEALGPQAAAERAEIVVVDDGSGDDTPAMVREIAGRYPAPLRLLALESNRGPGAARNRGVAAAAAPVCLLLGDDMLPAPGLVARHRAFHHANPGENAALLGRIVPAAGSDSPFTRWLHEEGKQFAFARIAAGDGVPARLFYAANCSLKRALLDRAGGFDESFVFGHEEQELSGRLARVGMRLAHDPAALAEHDHSTDLAATLWRMRDFGRSYRRLTELVADEPSPRRPGARHRVKAWALTPLAATRPLTTAGRTAIWEFLCDEAHREAFWGEPDPASSAPAVRIGAGLARLAQRDAAVRSAAAPARPERRRG
jgi:GT2 family glycosyltransferase